MSDEPETEAEPEAEHAEEETNDEPQDGPLGEARAAFDAGDFKRVRELTAKLADSDDPETARAALELRRKVAIDPAQIAVLVLCLGFFVWICSKYVF